jgi:nucleoside-diphosphate-sugar epimerase
VITSSVAAIYKNKDTSKTNFSVADWTDCEIASAYEKSKTMAERAAWDYVKNLSDEEKFEVVTINPGLVLGPNFNECQFSSGDIIKKLMLGKFPGLPKVLFPLVDVRNVAQAHLQGILVPEAANRRFMLVNTCVWFTDVGRWLHEKHGENYPKICKKELKKWMLWVASIFDAEAKTILPAWGVEKTYDNSETREILGIDFIDME